MPEQDNRGRMAQMEALRRLWEIANGHSGQCRTVAGFLLGLYNGGEYPFDLTDFRTLDREIFIDCLAVLALDYHPEQEIHVRLGVSGDRFAQLARTWGIRGREAP
jgi:hypothetical protein